MNWPIDTILRFHVSVMVIILLITAGFLIQKGLFRWNRSGFWAWASFLLYYIINPLSSLLSGELTRYQRTLEIAGGAERALWILFVIICGVVIYFFIYLRTKETITHWSMKKRSPSPAMILICGLFMIIGFYTLTTFRTADAYTAKNLGIIDGRFTGSVSGYASAGYYFLYVPIVLLMLMKSRFSRFLGTIFGFFFIYFTLLSGWGRMAPLSFLIAFSLVYTYQKRKSWPNAFFLVLLVIFSVSLQMRGHIGWETSSVITELSKLIANSLNNITNTLSSNDASMLSTWYLESYVFDSVKGFSYGIPPINYLLTGWIPSLLFPQKYFLIDWLNSSQPEIPQLLTTLLYGAKSSLLGSFYAEGGILGVAVLSGLAGFLSRKVDGMLLPDSNIIIKALALSWMSVSWMIWGSNDVWVLMIMGVMSMPVLGMWIVAPKYRRRKISNGLIQSEGRFV